MQSDQLRACWTATQELKYFARHGIWDGKSSTTIICLPESSQRNQVTELKKKKYKMLYFGAPFAQILAKMSFVQNYAVSS